jgi:4-amino-4-deoxy-L-arabinose transferase-like glycosyltransferase
MFHRLNNRAGHYFILSAAWALLSLPNLGVPSLWDIDEGHNAECAREMLDSGNWLVPTFNFQLRDHKPPLLYWLQIAAYERFGVNEFLARLPSALAALAAVLLVYELGRLMFGAGAGLLAGLILASAAMFCAAGHFANPDALLNALTLATFYSFTRSMARSAAASRLNSIWIILTGVAMSLAVLTKGPVGLLLPMTVIGLFLLWSRQLKLLLDSRLAWGVMAFILVAVPWYAWISAETKGEFTRGFFLTHNFGRFLSPMENHRGPIYYYLVALFLGFCPWSPLLIPSFFCGFCHWKGEKTGRQADQETSRPGDGGSPGAFLGCWIIVYMVFFTMSGTKLPNYILPIYPAAAILTGRFLDEWRRGMLLVPKWVIHAGLAGVGMIGIGASVGLLLTSGVIDVPLLRGRKLPGLEMWALAGLIPLAGSVVAAWLMRNKQRTGMIVSLTTAAILFVGLLAAWGSVSVDTFKAPRALVAEAGARQTDRDIRIGCYKFYQPSLVFYCRREVRVLDDEGQVREFLRTPLPVYLFVSAPAWEILQSKVSGPYHLLTHHRDIYKGIDVVVITNQ